MNYYRDPSDGSIAQLNEPVEPWTEPVLALGKSVVESLADTIDALDKAARRAELTDPIVYFHLRRLMLALESPLGEPSEPEIQPEPTDPAARPTDRNGYAWSKLAPDDVWVSASHVHETWEDLVEHDGPMTLPEPAPLDGGGA